MLVCHISLRPRGRTISAALQETVAAVDASATGQVVFATLVDDPASVGAIVDAYLGEIMLEAASASDSASVGLEYGAGVEEAATAAATVDGVVSGMSTRSAMVPGAFINPGVSREAYIPTVMVNLG